MAINKVVYGGKTLIDISDSTVAPETLEKGVTAYGKDGEKVTGSFTLEGELSAQDTLISQIKSALRGKMGGGTAEITLQEKSVAPTKSAQDIVADSGYDGLSKVTVEAIPTEYIIPSGEKEITTSGTYNVKEYASVKVTVSGSTNTAEEDVAALLGNTMTVLDNSIATSLRTRACQGSTKLVTVNLPNVTSLGGYAFYSCSGLKTIKLPKLVSVSTQVFYSNTNLQHADCGQLGNIPAQTFNACAALTELILRKTGSICTLSNVNGVKNTPIGNGTGYVYVPSALVDSYKTATNWSTFEAQFRAIEDYPEITGG